VQHLHEKGAAIRPVRPDPTWRDADEKAAWLERLGLVKGLERHELPWVEAPSPGEIQGLLATEDGLFGLRLGSDKDEVAKTFDVARAESGDGLEMYFDDDDELESVRREWQNPHHELFSAMEAALTEVFGKGKKKGKKRTWSVPDGSLTLKESHNDYYSAVTVEMIID